MTKRELPDEWPVAREIEKIEEKLAPYADRQEWGQKHDKERKERLGTNGIRLYLRISEIKTLLDCYDLTPEEAIECLFYEIRKYADESEELDFIDLVQALSRD